MSELRGKYFDWDEAAVAASAFNPRQSIQLKDGSTVSLTQYAARRELQIITAAKFNEKLREQGIPKKVTVQKVCRLARDEDEVRRTLDYLWSDSENAAKILKQLQEGNEDLYRFEKMLENGSMQESNVIRQNVNV